MIQATKFLVKEAALRIKYMTSSDCIFCKMVKGEVKTSPVLENEYVIAINDINPVADVHILIIPKSHIESALTVNEKDGGVIIEMFKAAQKIISQKKLAAFRLAFNGGAFQHVPHLHWHLVSGKKVNWTKL
jgi:histidine triad (HIT) family protein